MVAGSGGGTTSDNYNALTVGATAILSKNMVVVSRSGSDQTLLQKSNTASSIMIQKKHSDDIIRNQQ